MEISNTITYGDIIATIALLFSIGSAIITVIFVSISNLKIKKEMEQTKYEEIRANISITVHQRNSFCYIKIKNIGKTDAVINSVVWNEKVFLNELGYVNDAIYPFSKLVGKTLRPNEKNIIKFTYERALVLENKIVTIKYKDYKNKLCKYEYEFDFIGKNSHENGWITHRNDTISVGINLCSELKDINENLENLNL